MKNVVLFHGTGGNPDNFWFPWLRRELESRGYRVSAPQLPDPEHPNLSVWTPYALEKIKFDQDTIIIGHSAGCPLSLSVLEQLSLPVKRAVLVAGFIRLEGMEDDNVMLMKNPDWEKIKANAGRFFFFNSDNDPWGCTHKQGEALREKLGGTLIIPTGELHFGSKVFDQTYDTFPMLRDICLLD